MKRIPEEMLLAFLGLAKEYGGRFERAKRKGRAYRLTVRTREGAIRTIIDVPRPVKLGLAQRLKNGLGFGS